MSEYSAEMERRQVRGELVPWAHAQEQANPAAGGLWVVPSDNPLSAILDYVEGTGDSGITDVFGFVSSEGAILHYPTLYRCITLLSGAFSMLVLQGRLHVEDMDGMRVKTRRARAAVRLLTEAPDGGMTPAGTWHEEMASDYLLRGNALAAQGEMMGGELGRLMRLDPSDATITPTTDETGYSYRARAYDGSDGYRLYDSSRVIHVRWPRLRRSSAWRYNKRWPFAEQPVRVVRAATTTGMEADRHVREFFQQSGAHKSAFAISYAQQLNKKQRLELADYMQQYRRSRDPLVLGDGATITQLAPRATTDTGLHLRQFQVRETCRPFGVPPECIGEGQSTWGAGIAELGRFLWRFGLSLHVERLLNGYGHLLLQRGERFVVDPMALIREAPDKMGQTIQALQGDAQRPPVATREELRHIAGLPREADGEFVQVEPPEPPAPAPAPGGEAEEETADAGQ